MSIQLIYHLNLLPNAVTPSVFPPWRTVSYKNIWLITISYTRYNKDTCTNATQTTTSQLLPKEIPSRWVLWSVVLKIR